MLVFLGGGGVLVMLVAFAIGYYAIVGFNFGAAPKKGVRAGGFDETRLATMKCQENGDALRFADQKELDIMNLRVNAGTLLTKAGAAVTEPVVAVLIRADGKVGYRVDEIIPNMEPLEALGAGECLCAGAKPQAQVTCHGGRFAHPVRGQPLPRGRQARAAL